MFSVLRSLADVVLVGAGTVRAENYGPPRLPAEVQEIRRQRGQADLPSIAVVTLSGTLDWGSRLFSGEGPRPLVVAATTTRPDALARAGTVADVIAAGTGAVDLGAALVALAERGWHHVLCEGGPMLNTGLAAAALVDELCLTLSPKLAGCVGDGLRGGWLGDHDPWAAPAAPVRPHPAPGAPLAQLLDLDLAHVLEDEGFLFLRLRARYKGGSANP